MAVPMFRFPQRIVASNAEGEREWLRLRMTSRYIPTHKPTNSHILLIDYGPDYDDPNEYDLKMAFCALFRFSSIYIRRDRISLSLFRVKFYPFACICTKDQQLRKWAIEMLKIMNDPSQGPFSFEVDFYGGKRRAIFAVDDEGSLNATFEDFYLPILTHYAQSIEFDNNPGDYAFMPIEIFEHDETMAALARASVAVNTQNNDDENNSTVVLCRHWPVNTHTYIDFIRLKDYIRALAFHPLKKQAWAFAYAGISHRHWTKFIDLVQWPHDRYRVPVEHCYDKLLVSRVEEVELEKCLALDNTNHTIRRRRRQVSQHPNQ